MTVTCPHCRQPFEYKPSVASKVHLTPGERTLIQAKLEHGGEGNRQIAERFGTTEQVIKNRLRAIYQKLNIHSAVELALLWHQPLTAKPRGGRAA